MDRVYSSKGRGGKERNILNLKAQGVSLPTSSPLGKMWTRGIHMIWYNNARVILGWKCGNSMGKPFSLKLKMNGYLYTLENNSNSKDEIYNNLHLGRWFYTLYKWLVVCILVNFPCKHSPFPIIQYQKDFKARCFISLR